jgi:hypothetical protein
VVEEVEGVEKVEDESVSEIEKGLMQYCLGPFYVLCKLFP